MNFGLFILVLFGDALASSDQKLLLNCNQTYVYDAFGNPVYQELQTKPVCSIKETSIICSQNPRTGTDSSIVEKVNEQSNITCMAQDEVDGTIYYYTNRTYKYLNSGGSSGDLENISELQDPEDMTVDAYQKILFISLKTVRPKIVKYNILMKNWSVVTDENIKWPTSLAHDHKNRKVFWIDAKLLSINSCSYDGHCETVLKNHQNLSSPSSLAIENNTLYWRDTDLSTVLSCQADHCNDTFKIIFSVGKTCKEFIMLHEVKQVEQTSMSLPAWSIVLLVFGPVILIVFIVVIWKKWRTVKSCLEPCLARIRAKACKSEVPKPHELEVLRTDNLPPPSGGNEVV